MLRKLFVIFVAWPITRVLIGLYVHNGARLPIVGPAIVAANHNSHLDTLTLLSLVESALIVVLAVGLSAIHWPALLAGVLLMTPLLVCAGFLTVSRYDTLNEFIFPAVLVVAALTLPLLPAMGLLDNVLQGNWVYVMPLEPSWLLLQASVAPIETWQAIYGLAAGALWVALGFHLCRRAFYRFVIMKQGARA